MENDDLPPPIRLMNFVSEDQLEEAKKIRGPRVEDGTAQRDRPLYEILKENKDKKDAEFNERFKHRPPKPLDDDEAEFLETLETSRRELERQLADEEERQLHSFQAAVEAQSTVVHEIKEEPSIPKLQDKKSTVGKKNPPPRPIGIMIKVKPQAKKAKLDHADAVQTPSVSQPVIDNTKELLESVHSVDMKLSEATNCNISSGTTNGLVSYSDESDDD